MRKLFSAIVAASLMFSPALAVAEENPPVKMSNSGICHERGSTYYSRTKHFTAYPSMAACLKAGGRRPQR